MNITYQFIYLQISSITTILIVSLVVLVLSALITAFFLIKSQKKTVDRQYLIKIKDALGASNIENVSLEKQRVQIIVKDTTKINATFFTSEKLPAFISGNKITVLFKENAKEIYQFLISKGA